MLYKGLLDTYLGQGFCVCFCTYWFIAVFHYMTYFLKYLPNMQIYILHLNNQVVTFCLLFTCLPTSFFTAFITILTIFF